MKNLFWGMVVRVIGLLLIAVGGGSMSIEITGFIERDLRFSGFENFPFFRLVFAACIAGIGFTLYRYAKKELKGLALKKLNADRRAAVLYLRAFDDEEISREPLLAGRENYLNLLTSFLPDDLSTEEEQLAEIFQHAGPFICIGKPNDKLPPLGAFRFYFGDDWKKKVRELCRQAGLIVLRGNALRELKRQEGFRYELDLVWRATEHRKLVYLLPPKQRDVDSFLSLLAGITRCRMPEVKVKGWPKHFSGILFVDQGGEFQFRELAVPFNLMADKLSAGLKRTFDLAGIDLGTNGFVKVSLKARLKAFLMDAFLMGTVYSVMILIYFREDGYYYLSTPNLLLSGFYALYYGVMDFTQTGSSIGKRLCHIVVLDKEKLAMNVKQSLGRCVCRFIVVVSPLFFIIDVVLVVLCGGHIYDFLSATREFQVLGKERGVVEEASLWQKILG